ncbi:MAG: hypothetical protein ABJB78_10340, partial [Betaproteobacteria bacterium]
TGVARSWTFPRIDSRLAAKQQENEESLFVAKLSQGGHALLFSSLLYTGFDSGASPTGTPASAGEAIAVDSPGNVYLSKGAATNFPTTAGALQPSGSGADAVVFKLGTDAGSLALAAAANPAIANQSVTLTATGAAAGKQVIFYDGGTFLGVAFSSGGAAVLATSLAAGIRTLWASFAEGTNITDSKPIVVVVNPSAACD